MQRLRSKDRAGNTTHKTVTNLDTKFHIARHKLDTICDTNRYGYVLLKLYVACIITSSYIRVLNETKLSFHIYIYYTYILLVETRKRQDEYWGTFDRLYVWNKNNRRITIVPSTQNNNTLRTKRPAIKTSLQPIFHTLLNIKTKYRLLLFDVVCMCLSFQVHECV